MGLPGVHAEGPRCHASPALSTQTASARRNHSSHKHRLEVRKISYPAPLPASDLGTQPVRPGGTLPSCPRSPQRPGSLRGALHTQGFEGAQPMQTPDGCYVAKQCWGDMG